MNKYKNSWMALSVVLVWGSLSGFGLLQYAGTPLPYIFFCLAIIWLLLDSIYRPASAGYFFLVFFLVLGFWAKLVLHLWLDYPYLEPTGLFDGAPHAWDEVMWVSTVGILGVGLGKTLFMRYCMGRPSPRIVDVTPPVPTWYPPLRIWLWSLALVIVVGAPIANLVYGISQSGPLPRLSLSWPLNALMGWGLSFGLVALVFMLVGWDLVLGRVQGVYVIMIEGAMSGASSLSRATYIFHTIPALLVLFGKKALTKTSKRGVVIFASVWFLLLLASHLTVMGLRYESTSPLQANWKLKRLDGYFFNVIQSSSILIVDRWVGLEGVMSVVAYPHKSTELLGQALRERRVKGKVDLYTSEIARAGLTEKDVQNSQYATIPGGAAFFYYTGSLWWVLAGMSMLAILLLASERAVLYLTRNPFIFAFWGMLAAQGVASFGLGIGQQMTYYAVCFAAMGMIWFVQTFSSPIRPAGA